MDTKKRLARTIVTEFWGESAANEAEAQFERTVQRKETPDEIAEFAMTSGAQVLDVVIAAGLAPSKREARRLFEQRAVSVDGVVVTEPTTAATSGSVLQVGKRRWLRLV
jgi:tyrosyl-tRNA synthetase